MTHQENDTDKAVQLISDILTDPHWSPERLDAVPEDAPLGKLCRELTEIRVHVEALSKGQLNRGNQAHGFVAGSLKTTEANLRHLTWQMERVAQGDYSQSASFLGDFSKIFNKMRQEIACRSEELSRLLKNYRTSTDTDKLTGLLNRRAFFNLALSELREAGKVQTPLCLALADIDLFRRINEHFGHANGDRVLQMFACRMKEAIGLGDLCCRFGGDEFLLLIPRHGKEEGLQRINQIQNVCTLNADENSRLNVTLSFGVTFIEGEELRPCCTVRTLERAIQRAVRCLNTAKREGRNCIRHT